ncbi:MAG: hypothetical protein GX685_01915 [Clostridiales bacterium]|nr:hypothetical protein [Clostridiales bacterium]
MSEKRIIEITAGRKEICISIDEKAEGNNEKDVRCTVRAELPFGLKQLAEFSDLAVAGGIITIPRFVEETDLLTACFAVSTDGGTVVPGFSYVTKMEGIARNNEAYPVFDNPKTLSECGDDYVNLGISQTVININILAIMAVETAKPVIPFELNGRTFLFLKSATDELDGFFGRMKKLGITVTAILLNAPKLFDSTGEEALLSKCVHPDYDAEYPHAFISAFSAKTIEGQIYYQAFVEFLASRYSAGDDGLSSLRGMIVSNEVDSQYIWGNAGRKTPEAYIEEYTEVLRLTMQSARKYYANMRVYISLDHMFNRTFDATEPLCFYKGRQVLELLNQYATESGNFDWSVAYHSYPEDLRYPDFYNDRTAEFNFSTPRITFKNIEMLPAYLSQDRFLYRGKKRRIILSEQGFNSREDDLSERQGAAAYCLAYEKVRKLPDIDMMMHHAYADNFAEFGLHLGIRKRNPDGSIGEARPIYYVMKDMGTERERSRVNDARDFIGAELFDSILSPVILMGDDPLADNMQFQDNADGDEQ